MAVRIKNNYTESLVSRTEIVGNSASVVNGGFVSFSSGYIVPATTSGKIEWVANHTVTGASDNITVAKLTCNYTKNHPWIDFEVDISWGTITHADVGKYYSLLTYDTVDGSTESTSKIAYELDVSNNVIVSYDRQLRMVGYVSATAGLFEIV